MDFESSNAYSIFNFICSECYKDSCECVFTHTEDVDNNIENKSKSILNMSEMKSSSNLTHCDNIYDKETSVESDSCSFHSLYNASTLCDSVHDINLSPLSAQSSTVNLRLRGKGMRVGHLNIRGIRAGQKIDQIKMMLQSSANDISVLGVSESKLGDDIPDSFIRIENFQFLRKDKIQGSGGLIVYVRSDVSFSRRKDLEKEHFESIWIEIFHKNSKSFLVGHFYRNPSSNISWNDVFDEQVEAAVGEDKEIFLLGDFNRDLLNPQIQNQWLDYINSLGLRQHIKEPTRVVPNASATLLDHVYSNFSENIQFLDVPKIGLSDHYPVFFTRKINSHMPKARHHTIKYRSFKNFDISKFNEDLNSVPWDVIKVFDTVDDALDSWYSLFTDVIDKHVPLKQHRVKKVKQPDWLTSEIIDSIKTRDHFKAIGDMTQYKIWRNNVVNQIKKAKKNNYEKLIEEGENQPTTIWKIFSELGAGKQKSDSSNCTNSIKIGDHEIYEPEDMANTFNDFFVNVAENIKEPIDPSNHDKLKDYCEAKIPENVYFDMPLTNSAKVLKYLKNLDVRKSTGTDEIGPRLLKFAAPFIAESLTFICNLSIRTGSFPEKWKEAKVKPLHKGGPTNDLNNFRPISILPVLSKLFEKHVHESLLGFLEQYKLLYDTQSGFRPKHSCETALLFMVDKWLKALDRGELVGIVLVDFRKAFDLVDHDILLRKLEYYKLNQNCLNWFRSYLSGRTQKVSFKNTSSTQKYVKYGVPQGSILGPLLFLLFINDLPLHTNAMTDLYADDATFYEISKSKEEIERKLQDAILKVASWCKQNGMVINIDKTKAMLITTRQRRSRIDDIIQISLNNVQLINVEREKVLGVEIDNNLLWGEHVRKVTRKMSTNIWLLSKIKGFLSKEHRLIYYKSYIQPHLDYANIVWGSTSKTNLMQIERLQRRACRIILDYNVENIYQSMNDLKIMSMTERVFLRKAKFMYKVSNNLTPGYINEMFTKRQVHDNVHDSYVLRSMTADNFLLPKPNTELYKGSLAFSGPVIWSCLETSVKNAPSTTSFHSRCIKWMKAS